MKCTEINLEECPVAEGEEGDRMATCEMEAAEALAGLASDALGLERRELVAEEVGTSSRPFQDQPKDTQQFFGHASTANENSEKLEKIVKNIPSQLCSTSCQLNSVGKLRGKLTQAEKEEQKLRRIMANRESARQTIRRRQAMYQELTRKAADVLEENENLKKEKEFAVHQHKSLNESNTFLKAELAKVKKAEHGKIQEDPTTSAAERSCPAAMRTPMFFHNQPSVFPGVWPSMLLSSDVFQFQCACHSNVLSSLQYPALHRDIACSHQGQENDIRITGPGTPLFVVPVPWLLPFLSHSGTPDSTSGSKDIPNTHPGSVCSCSETMPYEDINCLSSNLKKRAEASSSTKTKFPGNGAGCNFPADGGGQYPAYHPIVHTSAPGMFSCLRPTESPNPTRTSQVDDTCGVHVVSAPEDTRHGWLHKNLEPINRPYKKSEDVFAAIDARRNRKELMKLKNIHCNYIP